MGPLALRAVVCGALLAPAVAADTVELELTGEVRDVTAKVWSGHQGLVERGVLVGAPVTLTLRFDDATPGAPGSGGAIAYDGAMVGFDLVIGDYTLAFDPAGDADNVVAVRDGSESDAYTFTAALTNGAGATHPDSLITTWGRVIFSDSTGTACDGEAIAQDPQLFHTGSADLVGPAGFIELDIETVAVGSGPGGVTNDPSFVFEDTWCQRSQLRRAGPFGRRALACHARAVRKPADADPDDAQLEACVAKATQVFAKRLGALDSPILFTCNGLLGTDDPVVSANALATRLDALASSLTADVSDDQHDRNLRARMLKALARAWRRECKLYAQFAWDDAASIEPYGAQLDAVAAELVARLDVLITKAAAKGVDYVGPSPEALADGLLVTVDTFVLDTKTAYLPVE